MSIYTTEEAVKLELGSHLVEDLLDLDEDETPDRGSMDSRIADASTKIDAYLSTLWPVPFEDAPNTPDIVALITKYLLCADILRPRQELSRQREEYLEDAATLLKSLLNGKAEIPGVAKLPTDERDGVGIKANTPDRAFAGLDSNGCDLMEYW